MQNKALRKVTVVVALAAAMLVAVLSGCSSTAEHGEGQDPATRTEGRGEHDREGGEAGGEHSSGGEGSSEGGGEELGTELALDEMYDNVRNGARLIMSYDAESNAFIGTVENTTNSTLPQVRVEVHLLNGIELGPTSPVDLVPGQKIEVTLPASSQEFDGWTAHPEVGGGEHGGGSESGGEHGSGGESGGEHSGSD